MELRPTIIASLFALILVTACRDTPPPPAPAPPPADEEVTEEGEELHPLMQIRQAYGLPLPPDVTSVRQRPNSIEVGTTMQIPELEKFFRAHLVDYEYVQTSKNDLRIIGLRSTMPRIYVFKRAPRVPVRVRYVQQQGAIERERMAENPPPPPPKKGDISRTTLSNGKQLAPGAVYGQPYTPKPGDPLYTESNRANFGKPFGTWILN